MEDNEDLAVGFRFPDGTIQYYTGRTGENWFSTDKKDAFFGFNKEGIENKGKRIKEYRSSFAEAEVIEVTKD